MRITRTQLSIILESVLLCEIFNTTKIYEFEESFGVYQFFTKDDLEYVMFISDVWIDDLLMHDVEFLTVDSDSNTSSGLTNKLDLMVYSTVIAIVRHHYTTVMGSAPTAYTFSSSAEFDGDKRRERVYRYILKQHGFSDLKLTPSGNTYFTTD